MRSAWKAQSGTWTVNTCVAEARHGSAAASGSLPTLKLAQSKSDCWVVVLEAVLLTRVTSTSADTDGASVKCAVTISPDETLPKSVHTVVVWPPCSIANQ